jgi:Tol biopolymer transport system component
LPGTETFAFYELNNKTARDIWTGSPTLAPSPVIATEFNERAATFSPDGGWLAYVSDEQGRDEVYVQRYPGPGGREVVSKDGGTEPVWSPDGRELFYRFKNQVIAVDLRSEPFRVRIVFEGPYVFAETGRANYDVSPDGRSFVLVRSVERSATHLHLIDNWFQHSVTNR